MPHGSFHGPVSRAQVDCWCERYYGTDIPSLKSGLAYLRRSIRERDDKLFLKREDVRKLTKEKADLEKANLELRNEKERLRAEKAVLRQENERLRTERLELREKYEAMKRTLRMLYPAPKAA
ncbi:hypothetical protein BST61_g1344 [Cercospora zeina]